MITASQSESSKDGSAGTSNIPPSLNENSVSPTENLFSAHSAIWRITRERILLLGGPAAAILQIAHPQVALGVSRHSDFQADTLGRLRRTLDAVYTVTFGTRSEVEAMAERVRRVHGRVQGDAPQKYSAFSPDAQMWVLATLVQLSVEMFERFVGPLSSGDRDNFYRDMRAFGTWFGLPASQGPANWAGFSVYYDAVLASGLLGSLPVSRELAHHIVRPTRPALLRALWPISEVAAREFLPSPLRETLGLPRTPFSRLGAAILDAALPPLLPALPDAIRFISQARRAAEALADGPRRSP